jgi:hypothetical protein
MNILGPRGMGFEYHSNINEYQIVPSRGRNDALISEYATTVS